jgi:drug/metabolite transporter (DMT)-like permease
MIARMGTAALLLALGAATLHAVWNLLLRGNRDTEAATAVAVVTFVVVLAPFAAATWDVDTAAWKYIVPSGALELVYVALLATAYRHFELSLVYPIARGLAPVATLVFAIVFVRARPSTGEIAGVVVVAAGVLLVRGAHGSRGAALGLAIAGAIGGYTLIDRYGIRHAGAFSYALLIMLGPALVYPPIVGLRRVRRAVAPTTVVVGILSAAAYLLVLLALRRASAPSVSAVRETGVVITAVLAAIFLRERVGPARLAGAVLVAAGIALLAL